MYAIRSYYEHPTVPPTISVLKSKVKPEYATTFIDAELSAYPPVE